MPTTAALRHLYKAWHVLACLLTAMLLPGVASASAASMPDPPPLERVVQVSAGDYHVCALVESGRVFCWGSNGSGRLGSGGGGDSVIPVAVHGIGNAVAVAAGASHTCAVLATGEVRCWGSNVYGQLGDHTQVNRSTPVTVVGLANVIAIDAGGAHSCALRNDGKAWCWGENSWGQLGTAGLGGSSPEAQPVYGQQTYVALTTGYQHSCGLDAAGRVHCWGVYDRICSLIACSAESHTTPQLVPGLDNVVQVSSGNYFSCALRMNGIVTCWGDNYEGQLGDLGTPDPDPFLMVDIAGLEGGATAVSAGRYYACARLHGGHVRCWGENRFGQFGDGSAASDYPLVWPPATVAGNPDHLDVATGLTVTCARNATSRLRCWGLNYNGQLGDGYPWQHPVPTTVPGLTNIARVAAGMDHACAIGNNGALHCWGRNDWGQLGDGSNEERRFPVAVAALPGGVEALALGEGHSCAIVSGGAQCWGQNDRGQLGDSSTTERWLPGAVSGLGSGITRISSGYNHSCTLNAAGEPRCWGDNSFYKTGGIGGSIISTPTYIAQSHLMNGVELTAGGWMHSCVLKDEIAHCWGKNDSGQVGNGSWNTELLPTPVNALDKPRLISLSHFHSCAVDRFWLRCWGQNSSGELGLGFINDSDERTPAIVVAIPAAQVSTLVAGGAHTCVRLDNAEVWCWGANNYGQIGNGAFGSPDPTPTPIVNLAASASIAAGGSFSCAVTTEATVKCWGLNRYGQLGIGGRDHRRPWWVAAPDETIFRSGFENH